MKNNVRTFHSTLFSFNVYQNVKSQDFVLVLISINGYFSNPSTILKCILTPVDAPLCCSSSFNLMWLLCWVWWSLVRNVGSINLFIVGTRYGLISNVLLRLLVTRLPQSAKGAIMSAICNTLQSYSSCTKCKITSQFCEDSNYRIEMRMEDSLDWSNNWFRANWTAGNFCESV